MQLLLDENAPFQWIPLLVRLGRECEHVIDTGLRGSADSEVLGYAHSINHTLLTQNKFKRGPDLPETYRVIAAGACVIRITVRGFERQQEAFFSRLHQVESAFVSNPQLRRVTLMNDFSMSYEDEADFLRKLSTDR